MVLFLTEAEVTGITQTGDDVSVAVEFGIHSGAPQGCDVLREHLAYIVNTGLSRNNGAQVYAGGSALEQQCAVSQVHTVTGSQHGVNQDQGLAVKFW